MERETHTTHTRRGGRERDRGKRDWKRETHNIHREVMKGEREETEWGREIHKTYARRGGREREETDSGNRDSGNIHMEGRGEEERASKETVGKTDSHNIHTKREDTHTCTRGGGR